jgi:DNA (cytosine-5)-methyltransferase 1
MVTTPPHIRRLTLEEALILHTFPEGYDFAGGKSATYRQIGNAVPCDLAFEVAQIAIDVLSDAAIDDAAMPQLALQLAATSR